MLRMASSAAATAMDGAEITRQGKPGKALKMSLYASVIAELISDIALIAFAVPMALFALRIEEGRVVARVHRDRFVVDVEDVVADVVEEAVVVRDDDRTAPLSKVLETAGDEWPVDRRDARERKEKHRR